MRKSGRHQVSLAAGCLICVILALRNTKGLEGTEFSGGWLTGPLLSMADIGTVLFVAAFIVAFLLPRIAAGIALASSLLCSPLYLFFIAPVRFSQIFGSGHQFKAPPRADLHPDVWALAGLFILALTGYLCVRAFRRNRSLT